MPQLFLFQFAAIHCLVRKGVLNFTKVAKLLLVMLDPEPRIMSYHFIFTQTSSVTPATKTKRCQEVRLWHYVPDLSPGQKHPDPFLSPEPFPKQQLYSGPDCLLQGYPSPPPGVTCHFPSVISVFCLWPVHLLKSWCPPQLLFLPQDRKLGWDETLCLLSQPTSLRLQSLS